MQCSTITTRCQSTSTFNQQRACSMSLSLFVWTLHVHIGQHTWLVNISVNQFTQLLSANQNFGDFLHVVSTLPCFILMVNWPGCSKSHQQEALLSWYPVCVCPSMSPVIYYRTGDYVIFTIMALYLIVVWCFVFYVNVQYRHAEDTYQNEHVQDASHKHVPLSQHLVVATQRHTSPPPPLPAIYEHGVRRVYDRPRPLCPAGGNTRDDIIVARAHWPVDVAHLPNRMSVRWRHRERFRSLSVEWAGCRECQRQRMRRDWLQAEKVNVCCWEKRDRESNLQRGTEESAIPWHTCPKLRN